MAAKVQFTLSPAAALVPEPQGIAAYIAFLVQQLSGVLASFATRLNAVLPEDGSEPMTGALRLKAYTVAALPAAGSVGRLAYVTDGDSALAWGATAVNSGAGATKYLVWDNGTHWTVAGK